MNGAGPCGTLSLLELALTRTAAYYPFPETRIIPPLLRRYHSRQLTLATPSVYNSACGTLAVRTLVLLERSLHFASESGVDAMQYTSTRVQQGRALATISALLCRATHHLVNLPLRDPIRRCPP